MAAVTLKPSYAPGYGPYHAKPFHLNLLTHSETRYQLFRELYQKSLMVNVRLGIH